MSSLESDSNLDRARECEGYKVLPPCVLYGKIGQGGMGAVYRGRHLNLDIDVAVKCLKPDLTGDDDQFVVRFRREARSAARINHQNVVRVFDVSEEKGLHYIVMELVQGETARQRVQRKKHIGVGEALEILYGAANGLGEAHSKGFIHRDVKPDNIMISASGQVKVADLGLAKPSGASNLSMLSGTNMVMGTPQYMPPEQWENTATVTPAADVWALGATLYYLLVGGEAISKDSLPRIMQRIVMQAFPDVREQRPDCPEDVAQLIAKATERDPDKRFVDARELAQAIDRLQTRRDMLTDCETVLEGDQNSLLSPPPAKTLAKIKFWLDEQSQRGGEMETMPAQGRTQQMAGPKENATIVQQAPTAPATTMVAARRGGGVFAAVLLLLVAAAGVYFWQPWNKVGMFAQADAYEKAGKFALAVAEVERVHGEDPSLAGKSERLGRLYSAWARQALDAGELRQALLHVGQAIGYADNGASRSVEHDVVQKVTEELEQGLVRIAPADQAVEAGKSVEFVGRLADPLVRDLRIARQSVPRDAIGGFRQTLDLRDATSASVELTLTTGRVLALRDWAIVYAKPAVAAGAGDETTSKPPVEPQDQPSKPTTDRPISSALSALPDCEFQLSAERLELVGDEPASLVITASEDAEVFVDGARLPRSADSGEVVHEVRSELVTPADVLVRVSAPGTRAAERRVPVTRRDGQLQFVDQLQFVGLKAVKDLPATTADEVQVKGRLNVAGAKLSVDGFGEAKVEWSEDGAFTATVAVPRPGTNRLRLRATRRFHRPDDSELVVLKLVAPTVTPFGTTRLVDQVSTSTYEVSVQADEWTEKVTVGSGSTAVTLRKDRDSAVFRGTCRLSMGVNVLPLVAENVLEQKTTKELRIERIAAAAPTAAPASVAVVPEIQDLVFEVDNKAIPLLPRPGVKYPTVFVQRLLPLTVRTNDPGATVLINNEPVQRQSDMTVSLAGFIEEAKFGQGVTATPVSVVLSNGLGQTPVTTFYVWLDSTGPRASCKTPTLTVARGQGFTLEGDWEDNSRVKGADCKLGDLPLVLAPSQGRDGSWSIKHPGLQDSTVLKLEFKDEAGNATIVEVAVTVQ